MQIAGPETVKSLRKLTLDRIITYVLIALMYLIVVLAIIDLGKDVVSGIITTPLFIVDVDSLLGILGKFLLVLVAIELLDTIKAYLNEHVVHAEVVLEAAIIAVARKIIILNIKEVTPLTILGIGGLLIALAAAFYVVRQHLTHTHTSAAGPQP